jgi:glycosyltransferase involved in cell wall biosynthesis
LTSVAWADEIVLVENNSTDGTADLARQLGAKVISTGDWPGFGQQKNRALDACSGDWILVLDCDERVDAALRDEIRTILANPGHEVYELPRRSTYCGQMIRHSGWWPDYVRRLFKRGAARFSDAMVHENLVTDRPIGRLKNPLTHFSFRSAEQVIAKMDRYSTDGAAMVVARGARPGLGTAIAHGVAAFLRTYIFKLGFLDGRLGFVLAVSNAEGSYYRYVKAWLTVRDRDGYARADRDADDRP